MEGAAPPMRVAITEWDNLEQAHQKQLTISGHVLGRVRGGLSVDVGVEAFMPGSQVDPHPVHNLDVFIGQDIPVKVDLGLGNGRATVWTCDLTKEYVAINGDYRS